MIKSEEVLGPPRVGSKLAYSGDSIPCKEMIRLAKDANVLIHESTYKNEDMDKAISNAHSTASQAAEIAKQSNVSKLILTHISTRYTNIDDLKKESLEIFENTEIAHDYMNLKI